MTTPLHICAAQTPPPQLHSGAVITGGPSINSFPPRRCQLRRDKRIIMRARKKHFSQIFHRPMNQAMYCLYCTEQAQRQWLPFKMDDWSSRTNRFASRYSSSAVAVALAVMIISLCFVGTIATQQGPSACSAVWSTASLSVARYNVAATSLPNQGLAIFAGGYGL